MAGLAVVAPGAASETLPGIPLTAPGLLAAALVLYSALALPGPSWTSTRWLGLGFALAIGVKLLAAATAPPVGLEATYWANGAAAGAVERATDYAWLANATRIDSRLDLRGDDFPVHFFNDAARFNFGSEVQPARDQLPFSVRWRGWLLAPSQGERRLVLEANGPTSVWLDDSLLIGAEAQPNLSAGLHPLVVEYTRLEASVPFLRLSWQRLPGGPLETIGAPDVRWQPSTAGAELSSGLGLVADLAVAGLLFAWLATAVIRARGGGIGRAALGAIPLLFLVYGMALLAPLAGRATILSGLDDWLIYESSARDILLNGPLMDGGQGHAPPYYGQPLYLYVLALAHRLTGESLFGPRALQFVSLGEVLVGTAVLARRAFGARVDALAALAFVTVLLQLEAEHVKVARQVFNENLYMPLVMASLVVVVSLARRQLPPAMWQAFLAGGLLGLTAISRSQFLLFVPFALLVFLLAWQRGRRRGLIALLAVVTGIVVGVAPVTARNWLVSGQLVPISSGAGASLLEFHRPPPGLIDQNALQQDALFNALHLDAQTRTVVAFMRVDPTGYLATLLPLGAHSIGLQGRNDPGVYWPLFGTFVVYLASFGLRATRRLHVWPIHLFIATHLLVLMLFEADTYGYRLVVPMYAPMAAVAAQVPLAGLGYALRVTRSAFRGNAQRATRNAQLGLGLVVAVALGWQAGSLAEVWPDRQTALVGLGGQAARAALTADRVAASAIYVASVDGSPRRFGSGSLPGLRYPWFKWFDPARSLPLPPPSSTAVYLLSELSGHSLPGDLVACLGEPDASGAIVIGGADARQRCLGGLAGAADESFEFDDLARIDAVQAPETTAAGESMDSRLVWQPLVAHPEPQQISLQLDDPTAADGTLWGNGTLELYPSREWQPDEAVLSRLPVATDSTAIPQQYRLTLGLGATRPNAAPAMATWRGESTARVPVASVTLTLGVAVAAQPLPPDMQPVEGPPLIGGGLELIAARPLPSEAAIGSPLRIGLLWRAMQDRPSATELKMRLVRDNGDVVQESVVPLLGGRLLPSLLHAGNVVRDEQTLLIGPLVSPERVSIEAELPDAEGDPVARLGSLDVKGRAHVFDASKQEPEAVFGEAMELLTREVVRDGATLSVRLRWRCAAPMQQAYKVFVHVLDASGHQVVAQRDAEPQDGKAPTTAWVPGEVIDDEYAIRLPGSLASGDYSLEVGVYDPRSGDRLALANGDNRFLLPAAVTIP